MNPKPVKKTKRLRKPKFQSFEKWFMDEAQVFWTFSECIICWLGTIPQSEWRRALVKVVRQERVSELMEEAAAGAKAKGKK